MTFWEGVGCGVLGTGVIVGIAIWAYTRAIRDVLKGIILR